MLDSLKIKNFRIFKDLEIDDLGQVNLIVGKNSSGKSCLLEALRVYASGADIRLLREMVLSRGEDLDVLNDSEDRPAERSKKIQEIGNLCNIFHGYRFSDDSGISIEIGSLHGDGKAIVILKLEVSYYVSVTERRENELWQKRVKINHKNELPQNAHRFLDCTISVDSKERELYSLRSISSDSLRRSRGLFENPIVPHQFVPAANLGHWEIADLWSRVSVRPKLKSYVLSALSLIKPGIVDVVMVTSNPGFSVRRFEAVVIFDEDRRMPLRGLGDGMFRLFHIIVAVAAAEPGGIVLIDEFENGLHWSVQSKAWELVFYLAKELNLQIFATTHSWDCVRAFQENAVTEANQSNGVLLHIGQSIRESKKGQVTVTRYSGESLQLANQAGLEVR